MTTTERPVPTIRFVTTPDDVLAAGRLAATRQVRIGYSALWASLAALGCLLVITGIGLDHVADPSAPPPSLLTVVDGTVGFAYFVVGLGGLWISLSSRANDFTKRRVEPNEITVTVDAHGLTTVSSFTTRLIRWHGITEIRDNDRAIVIMHGLSALTWLPTSAFGSQADRDVFLAFARAQIAAAQATDSAEVAPLQS